MPTLILDINPFEPGEAKPVRIPKNRKVSAICPACDFPVICLFNGVPLLRKGWNRRVKHGDVVAFVARPRGDDTLNSILRIVIAVVGIWIGGIWGAVFVMAANMALNAMIPAPKMPTSAQTPSASPTYTLGAQGNTARIEQPIPVQYGRHLAYPDFCATPYQEYADNEQWLYQVFCIGQGYFDIEAVRIEDTAIENFDGATYEIVQPNQKVTLFPSAVVQSDEVASAELGTFGPFTACGSGEQANFIGVDVTCPNGLCSYNNEGGLDSKSVTVRFKARKIDDVGLPLAAEFMLGEETISGATNTAIRRSFRYAVPLGRYEVSALRVDTKDTSSRVANTVLWSGLRAYLPEESDAGEITRLAVRLKATNQLSQQASRKINVIGTRKLHTWDPATGWSAQPVATRSIAWALADICRSKYGASLADDAYDLAGLHALNLIWTARNDKFDGRFDGKQTVGEALEIVSRAGRAKWYQQFGQVRFWRDQLQTLPQAVFQPRNIKPGTFSMDWAPAVTDTADSIRMTYMDERFWSQRDVICAVAGSAAGKPSSVNAFGMVQRRQVIDEGNYMAGDNRWRRRVVTFQTEAEGLIPRFGALAWLVHDVPSWGQSGDIVGWNGDTMTAILSEPPKWTPGVQHYIALVKADGRPTAQIAVSPGSNAFSVVLGSDPGFVPETAGKLRERTRYVFGPSGKMKLDVLIRRISPKDGLEVEIEAVVEDVRVHGVDGASIPDTETPSLPTTPSAPVVSGLNVIESGTPSAPIQVASWNAADGADHYLIEITTDGINWQSRGSTVGTSFSVVGIPAGQYLDIRVAGVGLLRGPWVSWHGTSGATVAAPDGIVDLSLESPFTGLDCRIRWTPPARADRYRVRVYAGGAMRREQTITECAYSYGIAEAAMDGGPWRTLEFRVLPLGVGAAESEATISATNEQAGQLNNIQVVSDAQGALWSCSPPGDVDLVGFKVWASQSSGFALSLGNLKYDGSSPIRQLPLEANRTWYVRCGAYDVWGDDAMNVSGEFIVTTGAIGASHISVASLSAIVANLGEIIAGRMHSADNAVDFDLDAKRLRVLDGGGDERLQLGLIGTDLYGLRVSNPSTGRSVVFSPDIGTVIAQGQATMPTTLNGDGTYSLPITLDKEYSFADLVVIVDIDDKPALYVDASWTSLSISGTTIREFHAHMASGALYKERDGNTAAGRAKYKSHTVSNIGREYNAVIESSVYSRWDKGSATSGSTIHISAAKTLGVYDRTDSAIKNMIEISWPVVVNYAVIAKNYQG